MYPELFNLGPIAIRSFGVGLALTFLFGVYYVRRVTARDGKSFEPYLIFAYIMIFGGVLGARLSFVALHWSDFSDNLLGIFNPFGSNGGNFGIAGLNLYGGILLAMAGSIAYAWYKKISILEVFDYFAPTVGLGLGVSRIGCFLNGCCYGTPTDSFLGVEFPVGSIPSYAFPSDPLNMPCSSVPIHPAQLYSSLYGFALFLFLHFLMTRKRFTGQLVALLLMSEAIFRFAIEYVRHYEDAMHFDFIGMHPTYNQVVSWGLFFAGLIIYIVASKRPQASAEEVA